MNLQSLAALMSSSGQAALQSAQSLQPREADYLTHYQRLCKQFPPDLAQAALETAILRIEAAVKFPEALASHLFLTREALEQATSFEVSNYRAERYRDQLNPDLIIDLGCSIGADTLSLASVAPTVGIDQDLLRLRMAYINLAAFSEIANLSLSRHADFIQADLTHALPVALKSSTALFFDPSRRAEHRRIRSVSDYQPPLQVIHEWLPQFPGLGVKLSPGVDLAELAEYHAEIEFISLYGELKECVLWFGPLRKATRRATLLPGPAQMVQEDPTSIQEIPPTIGPPQTFLYEPDPAVLRAGLVRPLAEQINARQLDPDIAYLTSQTLTTTPFARTWEIESWFPFHLKRLRSYLHQNGVGRVTVKKRGSPLQPEALIQALRLKGDAERVLVLTHLKGEPIVLICLPLIH